MIFKKQIESIIDTLNKISAGDLKQEINIYSGDVGRLAESINTVTENLTEKIDKLEKEDKYFLELHLNQGIPLEKLTAHFGVSRGAIDMRKSRIIDRLKHCFKNKGFFKLDL